MRIEVVSTVLNKAVCRWVILEVFENDGPYLQFFKPVLSAVNHA
jgi:hypothetical protein